MSLHDILPWEKNHAGKQKGNKGNKQSLLMAVIGMDRTDTAERGPDFACFLFSAMNAYLVNCFTNIFSNVIYQAM